MKTWNVTLVVESLESREVPARFTPNAAAVRADIAKIHTDTQTFYSNLATLAPTIRADQQAVGNAIGNSVANDASVQTAQATLNADRTTWIGILQADGKVFQSATTATARSAAVKQFFADLNTGLGVIRVDSQAIQTAIQADAGVQAAQAKLQSDAAPIIADLTTLQADYMQFQTDLRG